MTALLTDTRVLVVEDNDILATALAECLGDAGAQVLGPCSTVAGAMAVLRDAGRVDAAVLDVRLERETSEPVAVLARDMDVAVLLMTGFDEDALPESLRGFPVCSKPFDVRTLVGTVQRLRGGLLVGDAAS